MKAPKFRFFGNALVTKKEFEQMKKFAEDRAKTKVETTIAHLEMRSLSLYDKVKAYERSIVSMQQEIAKQQSRILSAELTLSKSLHNEAYLRSAIKDLTCTMMRKEITNEELVELLTALYQEHVQSIVKQMNFLHLFMSGNQSEEELRAQIQEYFDKLESINPAFDEEAE